MTAPTTSAPSACALCGEIRKLERGHIIPQFVYRWQFTTRKVGPGETTLNRKEFDGPTQALLCGNCEDSFARHESDFAREVFHPLTKRGTVKVKYTGWLRKFAASVAWRILKNEPAAPREQSLTDTLHREVNACADIWRDYLLDKRSDVGAHGLHLMPSAAFFTNTGIDESVTREQRHWVNSAIEMGIAIVGDDLVVHAKLGPLMMLGLVKPANALAEPWAGTLIHAEGKLKPRELTIPPVYLAYGRKRAALAVEA